MQLDYPRSDKLVGLRWSFVRKLC